MKKKSSGSSQPEKLVSVSADSILHKPVSDEQLESLRRLRDMPDSEIDFSDIPELTREQLASMTRPSRQLVAARLDRDVVDWLQSFGPGYSTRINVILRTVMEQQKATSTRVNAVRRRP